MPNETRDRYLTIVPNSHGHSAAYTHPYSNSTRSQTPLRGRLSTMQSRAPSRGSPTPIRSPVGNPRIMLFYPDDVKDVLRRAKQYLHLDMATVSPFIELSDPRIAHALDAAIVEFANQGKRVTEGYLDIHRQDILKLLYRDAATERSAVKKRAREVVRWAYGLPLSEAETNWVVHNGFGNVDSTQLVAAKVQRLLENDDFLKDGKDAQGRTNNIAHPSLRTVILQHYFSPRSGIAHIFPDRFTTVPYPTLAFVMAVIANCIQEYDQGPRQRDIELSAAVYVETYACMLGIIEEVNQYAPDPYHSLKLRSNLEAWAQAGMNIFASNTTQPASTSTTRSIRIQRGLTLD
ncbi:hypothetical protein DFH05DRAFT_1461142 [Lentinula detonsa]|uniref:DUF6532 domain-containing protein n=1 Tax=Lentinula detonsa TaxID=2804962 RepID=A0A9W8NXV8_9AGAR|nr:hypothetical protein DFH05DRAFT_1461142 [Lentinula detonsa]